MTEAHGDSSVKVSQEINWISVAVTDRIVTVLLLLALPVIVITIHGAKPAAINHPAESCIVRGGVVELKEIVVHVIERAVEIAVYVVPFSLPKSVQFIQ